jgi:hypothetical protein
MKRFGKIAVCLAGGLTLNAGLSGAGPASENNPSPADPSSANSSSASSSSASPYAAIAVRNIFGLNPPVVTTNDPNELLLASLPKITPTGIMSVFGQSKVLFKVAAAAATKARPPAKEEFYILSEGQRQDDIEVMAIDEENGLVTFDNHGFTQELPLANAPDSGAPAPSSPGPRNPSMTTGRRGGRGNINPGGSTRLGARSGGRNGVARNGRPGFNGDDGNGVNNGTDAGSSTQRSINQQEASTMTPEEAQIIIAAERLKAIQENDPTAPLYPPTRVWTPVHVGAENNPTAPLYPPTAIDRAAGISQGADAGSGPPAP